MTGEARIREKITSLVSVTRFDNYVRTLSVTTTHILINCHLRICVAIFFWDGSAWHASGRQKGAADEPLRGRLTYKP